MLEETPFLLHAIGYGYEIDQLRKYDEITGQETDQKNDVGDLFPQVLGTTLLEGVRAIQEINRLPLAELPLDSRGSVGTRTIETRNKEGVLESSASSSLGVRFMVYWTVHGGPVRCFNLEAESGKESVQTVGQVMDELQGNLSRTPIKAVVKQEFSRSFSLDPNRVWGQRPSEIVTSSEFCRYTLYM